MPPMAPQSGPQPIAASIKGNGARQSSNSEISAPDTIEAKVEGTPLGIVGRITATSVTRLSQVGDETKIAYEIDAAITGKLGSLGQPVLKSKAKDMEKQFSSRLREKFSPASSGAAS